MRIYLFGALVLCSLSCLGQSSPSHERPRKPPVTATTKSRDAQGKPVLLVRTIDEEPFVSSQLPVVPFSAVIADSSLHKKLNSLVIDPKYPVSALRAGIDGNIVMRLLIRADGEVIAGFVRFDRFAQPTQEGSELNNRPVITGSGRDQLSKPPIRQMAAEALRHWNKARVVVAEKDILVEYEFAFRISF